MSMEQSMYKVFIDLNEELSRIDEETRSIRIAEAARVLCFSLSCR